MAKIVLTLTDVNKDGTDMVNLNVDWTHLEEKDLFRPTQAMLAAKQIQHLFATGGIDASEAMKRLLKEAKGREVAVEPAKEG